MLVSWVSNRSRSGLQVTEKDMIIVRNPPLRNNKVADVIRVLTSCFVINPNVRRRYAFWTQIRCSTRVHGYRVWCLHPLPVEVQKVSHPKGKVVVVEVQLTTRDSIGDAVIVKDIVLGLVDMPDELFFRETFMFLESGVHHPSLS